ncbi:MAG: RNA polymerase sigma factor [Coriobacteriia bacterium]|jgi:RNA polymerase sigma-70 factor (ECF subfamily)|nr:RNA polymerase sigma factor [Coriobacteriia bacterium]
MATADNAAERELVNAAKLGDTAAFESLMRAHAHRVYAHGLRFFGDSGAADDVVQEVFVKVYRSIATFDGTAAFTTWLYRITRNVCLDLLRAGKRRPMAVDLLDVSLQASDDPMAEAITAVAFESVMRTLAPEDREALSAVTLFGLTYAQAGEVLGVPAGTVKSRVFRARKTLITALRGEGGVA